ncbi:MAG: HlyD family efflux transporter periplasmic adaptor subunit [bacterium]
MRVGGGSSRRWPYIFGAAVIAVIVIFAIAMIIRGSSNTKAAYKDVSVERGDIDVSILSTGVVAPENRLEIKPPIAGRVEAVLVDEGQYVKKGQVLVLMSSSERAALLDAARARGVGELARWQTFYKPAPILAQIDGTIILRSVEPGQTVTTSDAVLVMSDRLTVKAQVDETDIAEIKLKQMAGVILDAYPDHEIPAHVDKIAYDATTINNVTTYIIDVLPDETPEYMRSGMTANVRFAVESTKGILVLPANAVKTKGKQHFVTLPAATAMATPAEKEVETGVTNGKLVEIVSGLSEGDVVLMPQQKRVETGGSTSPFSPLAPRRR